MALKLSGKGHSSALCHLQGLPSHRHPGASRGACRPISMVPGVSCSFLWPSFLSLLLLFLLAKDALVLLSSRASLQVSFTPCAPSTWCGIPLHALSPTARASLSTSPQCMPVHSSPHLHLSSSLVGLFNSILEAVFIKDMTLNRTIQFYPKQSPGMLQMLFFRDGF